jgi:hypothetical protein
MKSRVIQDEPERRPGNTPAAAPPPEPAPARTRTHRSTRTGLLLGMLAAAVLIGVVLFAYAL